jgi:anthranilate synthase/aminodeoxychorismate synthase-like glutamine amidotransferase
MRVLLIDNYDSFTWNLVQRLWEIDPTLRIEVVRNDAISPEQALTIDAGKPPARVIISPGPCTPDEAGVSRDVITAFAGRTPILGVCLGHQCIGSLQNLPVVRHNRIVHGKTSPVHHDNRGVFEGLPNPFTATRYHSLVVDAHAGLPEGWQLSAWTDEHLDNGTTQRVVMGLRKPCPDGRAPIEGVQFHPESFLTTDGPKLLANFLGLPLPATAPDSAHAAG